MHQLIMQAHDGPKLQAVLNYIQALGVTRVIYPTREYGKRAADANRRRSKSLYGDDYETARLFPRGSDDGFAEQFLNDRRRRP